MRVNWFLYVLLMRFENWYLQTLVRNHEDVTALSNVRSVFFPALIWNGNHHAHLLN